MMCGGKNKKIWCEMFEASYKKVERLYLVFLGREKKQKRSAEFDS